jgi:filamentous hemagglutinin
VTYLDRATGQYVSTGWNNLSPDVQDAIRGGATVASILIPAGAAGRVGMRMEAPNRTQLIDELVAAGTKVTPGNVVDVRKLPDGRTVWLETGSDAAGLQHIYKRHEVDFANKGIARQDIPTVVMDALGQGNIVGTNGSANVYRIVHNGVEQNIAIGLGSNGFVVRANPVSTWNPLP